MATATSEPATLSLPRDRRARPEAFPRPGIIAIAQLMIVLDASVVTIALPSAQRALHISVANRQWALTAYTLAFGGLLLIGGRMADYLGRKRMFIISLLGFAAASALGGLAQNSGDALRGPCAPGCLCRRHGPRIAVAADRDLHRSQRAGPGLRRLRGRSRRRGRDRAGARRGC